MSKWILVLAVVLGGCLPPMEEHGGAAPRPEASDAVFLAGGAALNEGLIVVKAPLWSRLLADVVAVWALRYPRWGGRNEGVAITVPVGAFVPEMVHFIRTAKARRWEWRPCAWSGSDGEIHHGLCRVWV